MSSDTWGLVFAAASAIGAAWMVNGKTLTKNEKTGIWIIFVGFVLQTVYYIYINQWTWSAILLLVLFIILWLSIYFVIRKIRNR